MNIVAIENQFLRELFAESNEFSFLKLDDILTANHFTKENQALANWIFQRIEAGQELIKANLLIDLPQYAVLFDLKLLRYNSEVFIANALLIERQAKIRQFDSLIDDILIEEDIDIKISTLKNELEKLENDFTSIEDDDDDEEIWKRHYKNIEKDVLSGGKKLVKTGLKGFDNLIYLVNSETTGIAARPSMGKTSLMQKMALNMGEMYGIKTYFDSLEMTKEVLMNRFISYKTGISTAKINVGLINGFELQQVEKATNELSKIGIKLDEVVNFSQICRNVAKAVKRGCKIAFIDYLQITTGSTRTQRNLEIGDYSMGFKQLAKKLNIPIIIGIQFNRDAHGKRPTLADLGESGKIEQDFDNIIAIHRKAHYLDEDTKSLMMFEDLAETELIALKHRNGELGTGKIAFFKGQFMDLDDFMPQEENTDDNTEKSTIFEPNITRENRISEDDDIPF